MARNMLTNGHCQDLNGQAEIIQSKKAKLRHDLVQNGVSNGIENEVCDEHKDRLKKSTFRDLLSCTINPSVEVTDEFLEGVFSVLKDHIHATYDRSSKVIDFKSPDELQRIISFGLEEKGQDLNTLVETSAKVLAYSVKTGHPRFYNQLFAGLDITGLIGQWVGTTANTSMYTYETAPVFIVMEYYVLSKLREYIGFSNGDGMFFPGGSISNIQAMNIARYKACPEVKEEGLSGLPKLVCYVSEEGHYSTMKAAATLGIGTKNCRKVKTDDRGKMVVEDLEEQLRHSLEKGEKPFYVCATSGTTVAGAYDSLHDIAGICEKYGIWMHVDAAWGGGALLSKKWRHLMDGVERANSVTWNPHKLMGVPFQMSALLTKEKGLLQECNKMGAKYLFQKDKKLYDVSWDTGDKTIQCGRNNDIFKLWITWKAKGLNGLEEQIDSAFENSRYLAQKIKEKEGFTLLMEPECTNVCFRYTPPSLRNMLDGQEKNERLSKASTGNQCYLLSSAEPRVLAGSNQAPEERAPLVLDPPRWMPGHLVPDTANLCGGEYGLFLEIAHELPNFYDIVKEEYINQAINSFSMSEIC